MQGVSDGDLEDSGIAIAAHQKLRGNKELQDSMIQRFIDHAKHEAMHGNISDYDMTFDELYEDLGVLEELKKIKAERNEREHRIEKAIIARKEQKAKKAEERRERERKKRQEDREEQRRREDELRKGAEKRAAPTIERVFGDDATFIDAISINDDAVIMELNTHVDRDTFDDMLYELRENGGEPKKLNGEWIWILPLDEMNENSDVINSDPNDIQCKVEKMREDGHTYKEIQDALNMKRWEVYRRLKDAGLINS
jgi:hypothetical protein